VKQLLYSAFLTRPKDVQCAVSVGRDEPISIPLPERHHSSKMNNHVSIADMASDLRRMVEARNDADINVTLKCK
jgi:hypothetical protein